MTKEERELLEPIVREIMGKSNKNITDDDLRKAMEQLNLIDEASAVTNYSYEHPDYGKMVGDMPDALQPLLNTDETHPDLPEVEDFMDSCAQLDRSTLVTGVNSIIYFWMDRWHTDPDGDVWMHPIHVAIMIAERFQLHECLPVLLETERQDRDFAEVFFDDCDMVGMLPACIYHITTAEDLPMLADFVHERGIHSFSKAEVIAAVSTVPRREPQLLPDVQRWLSGILAIFADGIDPSVGDVMLLEAIIHCCLHTRNVDAKPMIIRMYSKYKLPNILIPGGANEVRKTIKKADIGILKEQLDSSETIWQNAATTFDEDDFDDGDYDHDYVAADFEDSDDEIEYYEDEEWAPRQEYCGYAYGGKAKYLPVQKLKKSTLRIELENSEPLIWRELEVPSNLCLTSLAQAILLAFGWNEDHLHQFLESRKNHYATSLNELGGTLYPGTKDGSRYGVSHLLKKQGDSVLFEYDYGDSWYHKVKLKSVADYADYETKAVRLIGGANACPPDDCGGIYRYRHLVELMQKKPQSSELSEFYDWMGCKWDPEFFPMDETAKAVDKMNK
ncbi:MAG: plasmid pRiA4b ORF-3 family protein [Prevotella sp.]|nr:plasmid pRiA4b ORF-3 family protein [Prevotella sp.]MBR3109949.1 plasmid pRiA4b ORF-3 family protein [Prevotella sp.]